MSDFKNYLINSLKIQNSRKNEMLWNQNTRLLK